MNERKTALLRALQKGPRTLQSLTASRAFDSVAPIHLVRYLNEMVEDGLIANNGRDVFSLTAAGLAELTKPVERTPSRVYGNASTCEPYTPPAWVPARPNANDFLRYQSRGV